MSAEVTQADADESVPKIDATNKLSEDEEREIAFLAVFGIPSNREVASMFDISPATVTKVTQAYGDAGPELEHDLLGEFGEDFDDPDRPLRTAKARNGEKRHLAVYDTNTLCGQNMITRTIGSGATARATADNLCDDCRRIAKKNHSDRLMTVYEMADEKGGEE